MAWSVDWRWIGGGNVKGVGGRVAVVWWSNWDRRSGCGGRVAVAVEWWWRLSGGGSESGGEGEQCTQLRSKTAARRQQDG